MSRLTIQYGTPQVIRLHGVGEGLARYEIVREARFRVISAAEAWELMDFDRTDSLSVDEMGIDYGWPEPGDCVATEEGTAQLYWPQTGPKSTA